MSAHEVDAARVPPGHGEVLALPALSEYGAWMEANRKETAGWGFEVARGLSYGRWRGVARGEVYDAAVAQGMCEPGQSSGSRPILLSGHQPELLPPGPWIKNFILDAVAQQGTLAVELLVDSDLPGARAVVLPTMRAGRLALAVVDIPGIVPGRPWERQPPLTRETWRLFLDAAALALESLPSRQAVDRLEHFREVLAGADWMRVARNLGESLAGARRAWEGQARYLEFPVSRMSGLQLRILAGGIIERLEEFHEAHNGALAAHRLARGIRSTANPFPDLRHRDDLWEMPFWFLHPNGERRGLFAQRSGRGWVLASGDLELARVESARDVAHWANGLPLQNMGIRPRALTLTMYARLASDLFLHGVGGAHYDRVTDAVIERFFGVRPPRYAVASATLFPDLGPPHDTFRQESGTNSSPTSPQSGAVMPPTRLQGEVRDLTWNPQRHGGDPALAEQKAALIADLEYAPRGRRARLTREIHAVNDAMAKALAPQRERLERALERARAEEADLAVLHRRTYPCFLFEPDDMRRLVNKM